jgi:SAM-dependent methyltransferase
MRTKLSADNPHGHNRYGFAWHHIPQGGAAHLDFGCYDGAFLATLKSKGITRLVGVDISADAVRQVHERFADIEVIRISKTVPLPFGKGAFTSITILDVIEHVDEQRALLDELNRVLQDNGILVVTAPGRHLFPFWMREILNSASPEYTAGTIAGSIQKRSTSTATYRTLTVWSVTFRQKNAGINIFTQPSSKRCWMTQALTWLNSMARAFLFG